jgi:hypothetical protein
MKLSEAVIREGYRFVEGDIRELARGAEPLTPLGTPAEGIAVCEGCVVVCYADCWDYAYSVSHEIVEHRHKFQHTPDMFAEQANLLARWLRQVAQLGSQ